MIEKRFRHLQRYKDIIVAFSRNGFGFLLEQLGLNNLHIIPRRKYKERHPEVEEKSIGERVRLILEELGPTFIKFGQIASTRPDLLTNDMIEELEKLQTHVPAFPFRDAKYIIESELGRPIESVFHSIEEKPLAAASIGQVHLGVLKTGEQVAIKVQRPKITKTIETDFEILKELASLAELRIDWAARYRVIEVVDQFSEMIRNELDYIVEARSAKRIASQLANHESVKIPTIYEEYSTSKVLVMEYIVGEELTCIIEGDVGGYDQKVLANTLAEMTFQQVFIDGFFHADPHPGNMLIQPNNKIVLLDFGMVGRLTSDMKENFGLLLINMMRENIAGMTEYLLKMGTQTVSIDEEALKADVEVLMDKYYRLKISEISMADAIRELFQMAHKHEISLSPDYTTLAKTLLTLEGTIAQLDPDLSLVEVAKPFGEQLIRKRYRPKRLAGEVVGQITDYMKLFADVPGHVKKLSAVIKKDRIRLDITLPDMEQFLKRMDRIGNQLSFAIVLLAFSIIMVGLIIGSALAGESTVLWSIPAIEIGSFVALFMFLWLIYSIFKSGRF